MHRIIKFIAKQEWPFTLITATAEGRSIVSSGNKVSILNLRSRRRENPVVSLKLAIVMYSAKTITAVSININRGYKTSSNHIV